MARFVKRWPAARRSSIRHGMALPSIALSTAACEHWGGGVPISSREFRSLRLKRALDRRLRWRLGLRRFHVMGPVGSRGI